MKKRKEGLQDQRELSQEVVELMSSGITETQARQTLEIFQDLETSINVASFYIQDKDKKTHYENYEGYLQTVKAAMENPYASKPLHQQEVEERANGLPLYILKRANYRKDSPTRSSHYWEHLASQE
ncbi:hypothetical protein HYV89_02640 [Candidatus Woesearchaeota archaeon]|nr:hypothetical protein [Candidatus Woesearchaeota archaeon]